MKKLIALLFPLTILFPLNIELSSQCLKNTGVWVGAETNLPGLLIHPNRLYKNYESLYIKTLNNKIITRSKNSCRKIYAWYEDGLSLNILTPKTKDLVFPYKVDSKYWLDIRKKEARQYIINNLVESNKYYPIHLDDHWSLPKEFGDLESELNNLTKEVFNIIGPISLSVLPLNYAKTNYNTNWLLWLEQGYINEIILQNYVPNNFEHELALFHQQTNKYNIKTSIGLYQRNTDLTKEIKSIKNKNLGYTLFSLRTVLLKNYN